MRVALVVDRLRPGGGGLERYLGDLGAFLLARGDSVTLVSLGGSPAPPGGGAHRIGIPALPRGMREIAFAGAVERRLASGAFDASLAVRHVRRAHVYEPHGGSVRGALAAREGTSTLPALARLAHRIGPRGIAFRRLERSAIERSKVVVAVSERVRGELAASSPARRDVRVLPLGVDLERFSPSGRAEPLRVKIGAGRDEAILLFAGSEFALKGLARAIETVACLAEGGRSVRLVVFGRGRSSERRKAQVLARARGVEERISFAGAAEDLASRYRGADLLLHPTRYDACSLVVLEALACGTPVVTTPANGAVSGRSEGFRIVEDPDDASSTARAVEELLDAGDAARSAARAAVEGRDAADRHARMRDLLASVAGPLDGPLPTP